MEATNSLECPICYSPYNKIQIPRIIPCNNGHSVCSVCIENILASQSQHFICPFDRTQVKIKQRTLEAFPKNLALLDLACNFGATEFCKLHALSQLDLVCIACRKKICYKCEKIDHKRHQTEMLSDIPQKIKDNLIVLKNIVEDLENIETEKENVLLTKEEELLNNVENQFDIYINLLNNKKEMIQNKIKDEFREKRVIEFEKSLDDSQIMQWKERVREQLLIKNHEEEFKANGKIPYELFEQEEILNALSIENWISSEKDKIEKSKKSLEEIRVDFNNEFLDLLQKQNICNLERGNELKIDKKSNSDSQKVEETKEKPNDSLSKLFIFFIHFYWFNFYPFLFRLIFHYFL